MISRRNREKKMGREMENVLMAGFRVIRGDGQGDFIGRWRMSSCWLLCDQGFVILDNTCPFLSLAHGVGSHEALTRTV